MKRAVPPMSLAGSQLGDVRHVCAFFNSDDEEYRVLLPFIKDGFESGDKAIHVVNPDRRADHLERLEEFGIDTADGERRRQLEVRTNAETYLSRIVCHMDWAADTRTHVDDLVEFESRVNDLWCDHDDAVVCTYNLAKFGGDIVMDMVRTHPMVIIGGILHQNPFYLPPERFLREFRQRRRERAG